MPIIKILLIEDDLRVAHLIQDLLEPSERPSYRVTWASHLYRGMEMLKREYFSLCILDLNLPDSKGLDTLRTVREAHPPLPLLILTGMNGESLRREILKIGANEFLEKQSLTREQLRHVIFTIFLQRWAQRDEGSLTLMRQMLHEAS